MGHARAMILVEQAWKEVVQLAAESLGWRADGIASGVSDSLSELGEQYKIMRNQLETNIAKLDEKSQASHRMGTQTQPDPPAAGSTTFAPPLRVLEHSLAAAAEEPELIPASPVNPTDASRLRPDAELVADPPAVAAAAAGASD